ncbi:P-loop containing nucleoside triphosphate hydrolase protein [Cladorrhinum sp. PSN332]|nr:P-loop containing nucleoside triphosphate hydrolase protein [Cladorrhinum sp. PSN332]
MQSRFQTGHDEEDGKRVGKTLTAESVADYTKKPLLRIQAETLGSTAHSVEQALTSAFRLATSWNAVALLDEADVFLEERRSRDVAHNALVAVFLRMIEYYGGILFLTTNRVSSFDTAFKSRIHLAIHYPPLDSAARQKIWRVFLSKLPNNAGKDLLDGDHDKLEEIQDEGLNGRQIKNIVRTAHSLAISTSSNKRYIVKKLKWPIAALSTVNTEYSSSGYTKGPGTQTDCGKKSW